ncbi:hypothetical protein E4665_14730 [Sporolactobacillus shoreae]|uniref:Uncharacterized protein n=1 Tax=Sporolactobacillus shoreae TaxID=1465501 RepID=A0A4Z0GKW3_9BACL|nr:hypothetical protein [Sporolactobacillus shoreae]TGA96660.1 hypothetical protein E4665_14730 [Sporolactobacillus shoreae]
MKLKLALLISVAFSYLYFFTPGSLTLNQVADRIITGDSTHSSDFVKVADRIITGDGVNPSDSTKVAD